ncbi:UDP-2,4-diacetamido-2,4,6-trideoxy-beta-L-altropyranose hydrolase [Campylobacter troglodytis]|uniref:UDP-2,4-diacetamido-2,4, 6-trideoxy-beta-L-altropyranose hydrolase n=1 Tax=Campylobacter troglodytis TaxID=654363 RepID=UPI0011579446|nr:UDP-2,4-diacetamido-2,4,6-trideoxy-beta-L-altropyranose hydrolase [Campylobacter troglodytis]TQR59609.1 UDP-2,4-diacetamido-2,4,6-trideoxy-beta-L-altropyranose hydrolase [Campylobacter troglodytis]
MKVLFRADSSSKMGHGHIRRDLLLAKSYDEVSFACLELQGSIIDEIPYEVFLLDSTDRQELVDLIRDEGFELLVIDHYGISYEDELFIKKATGVKILSFDDDLREHYCDILLNVNPYAKPSLYKKLVPSFCELRCGFAHALFRDEFYEEVKIKRDKIYDFFICLGATDSRNLSAKIALNFDEGKKIFIATTSANTNLKQLKSIADKSPNITLGVDIKDFAKTMNQSKKLIISASGLVNEAIFLKAEFKAVCTNKNQIKIAQWLKNSGKEVDFYDYF